MTDLNQIMSWYGIGALSTSFLIALLGDNKNAKADIIRIVLWPITLATTAGQLLRAIVRSVF